MRRRQHITIAEDDAAAERAAGIVQSDRGLGADVISLDIFPAGQRARRDARAHQNA